MAKKSKTKKNDIYMMLAGGIAGAIATKVAIKYIPIGSELVKAIIPTGAGAYIAITQKAPFVRGLGIGMTAAGGFTLATALIPGLSGITVGDYSVGSTEDLFLSEHESIEGPADQSILSEPAGMNILSGYDEQILNSPGDEIDGPDEQILNGVYLDGDQMGDNQMFSERD